jgi:hypothetical protein
VAVQTTSFLSFLILSTQIACHLSDLIGLDRVCSVFIQIAFWALAEKRNDFPIIPKGLPLNGKIFLCFVKNHWRLIIGKEERFENAGLSDSLAAILKRVH